jgi:glycosyltransferase involved in cell wall biosynthesis
MMRVVHVVSQTGTYGGERLVAALARAQRAMGIDARIVTIYDSVSVEGVSTISAHRGLTARGGGMLFFFRLVSALRRLQPDVVHTHLAHAKYWGRLAAAFARAPHIIHTEHGNDFRASGMRRTLTSLLHRRTDSVVAFTREHAQRISALEGYPLERIAIIPNGIVIRNRHSRSSRGRTILFIGRLDPIKRPERAIEALALLPRDTRLVIAGDGRLRQHILNRARELRVNGRVRLLGYRRGLNELLAYADAVVNTSDSEAMPLSLIEARCAGVPVVATPWPGAHELLGEAGAVSADFAAHSIAEALVHALAQPPISRPSLENVRAQFSIERCARSYADLYATVLAPAQGRLSSPSPDNAVLGGLTE